jgi:hypothetical protein
MHGQEKSLQPEIRAGAYRGNEDSGHQRESNHYRDSNGAFSGIFEEGKVEEITRMARVRRLSRPADEPLPGIAQELQRMARRILSKQPIFFTAEEFAHCWRALRMISNRTGNLERIFEAAGKRSAEEFKQAMKIIRGFLRRIRSNEL